MEPTLLGGDRLVCGPTARWVRRGALVVFPHPLRPEMSLVKRVVGLAREVITLDFGQVLVDGRGGVDRWGAGGAFPEKQWTVGLGEIFVLSDNRSSTIDDSRHFGPISLSRVAPVIWRHRPRVHR
jgi:signal peptidase I